MKVFGFLNGNCRFFIVAPDQYRAFDIASIGISNDIFGNYDHNNKDEDYDQELGHTTCVLIFREGGRYGTKDHIVFRIAPQQHLKHYGNYESYASLKEIEDKFHSVDYILYEIDSADLDDIIKPVLDAYARGLIEVEGSDGMIINCMSNIVGYHSNF